MVRVSLAAIASASAWMAAPVHSAGIDLGSYSYSPVGRIDIGAPLSQDGSGLTFNPVSSTLYVVRNSGPERIFEMDTAGNVLRTIGITGFQDTEGIAYLGGNTFAVTEERRDRIAVFEIGSGSPITIDISAAQVYTFSAASGLNTATDNFGLEGLSYNPSTGTFAMVQEKSSVAFFEFSLPAVGSVINATSPFNLSAATYGITDAAGVVHLPSGNVLILSDESETLLEIDPATGDLIGTFDLGATHPGGSPPASYQPEGVAFNPATGDIYVLSEPDAFYVLSNPNYVLLNVPEPSRALLLMGGAAAGIAFRRRRR